MSQSNERGANTERNSALWGTGGRGGDRSSVLWGKGGRGMVATLALAVALAVPLAAMADGGHGTSAVGSNFIAPGLLKADDGHGNKVDVIVSYNPGLDST